MPAKTILSPAQRAAIFDPPFDRTTIERLYTLGPDDLVQVARRRRGPNRIGHAVQLCYLRHPGRALVASEAVPDAMLDLLAGQIGCDGTDFADYAARPTTLREHRAEIEAWLGLRAFERADVRSMLAVGSEIAASTDRGETIVAGMVDRLRRGRIVLPAASTLERLALIVRTRARKAAYAGLIRDCPAEQEVALDHLIASDDDGRTRLGWIREWPEAPSAANLKGIVERLDAVRAIGIAADGARRIHAARYAVIARTAGLVTAQHLRRLERPRRLAMLVASMIEMEAALTDAALVMVEKMVGALFRRADRTRSDRLLGHTAAEMTVMRRGLEAAFDQLEKIEPVADYKPQLAQLVQQLAVVAERLHGVEQSPILRQGPEHYAARLERGGEGLVRTAVQQLERQAADLERAGRNLAAYTKSAYDRKSQDLRMWVVGGAGLVLGAFLLALLPRWSWGAIVSAPAAP